MAVIYIAGPMTGYANFNKPAFNEAAKQLEKKGDVILNPAILPDGMTHDQYMVICLAMVDCANELYMLKGWRKSKGAKLEYQRARKLKLKITQQSKGDGC